MKVDENCLEKKKKNPFLPTLRANKTINRIEILTSRSTGRLAPSPGESDLTQVHQKDLVPPSVQFTP